MEALVGTAKSLKKSILKSNVRRHLLRNFDWKVARAIATDTELSEGDKDFRAKVVAEYDRRIAALDEATTIDAVSKVRLTF